MIFQNYQFNGEPRCAVQTANPVNNPTIHNRKATITSVFTMRSLLPSVEGLFFNSQPDLADASGRDLSSQLALRPGAAPIEERAAAAFGSTLLFGTKRADRIRWQCVP